MHNALGLGLLALLVVVGCGDESLTTTGKPCAHGERSFEIAEHPGYQLDALIVVDPALGERIRPRLATLIEALATSNIDDYPDRELFRNHELRVAIATAAEATRLFNEPEHAIPFARYQYAPYGYGDDVTDFVERALCLQTSDAAACASDALEGDYSFASSLTAVYVITDRDACAADASESDCDGELTELIAAVRAKVDYQRPWELTLIAGVPEVLATLARSDELDRYQSEVRPLSRPASVFQSRYSADTIARLRRHPRPPTMASAMRARARFK